MGLYEATKVLSRTAQESTPLEEVSWGPGTCALIRVVSLSHVEVSCGSGMVNLPANR